MITFEVRFRSGAAEVKVEDQGPVQSNAAAIQAAMRKLGVDWQPGEPVTVRRM